MLTLANVGLPMFMVLGPFYMLAFIPIVLIEAAILKRVASLAWKRSLAAAIFANLISTIVGVPCVYFALLAVQWTKADGVESTSALGVLLRSPWPSPPYEDGEATLVAAAIVLCIPFFIASWIIERMVLLTWLDDVAKVHVRRGVLFGNALTYAIIAVFWLATLLVYT
jgi:hypothetical protein